MMKKLTAKKAALLLAALFLLLGAGVFGFGMFQRKGTLQNENYIASNFLEMGLYARGRSMASQALELSPNDISRQLILLSFCYEQDFKNAQGYGAKYLKKSNTDLTDEIYQYAMAAASSGGDNVKLIQLHNKVKEQFKLSGKDTERLHAAQEILGMGLSDGFNTASLSENMESLENATDVVSLKAKAYGSALLGDEKQAAVYAQQLVQKDSSLPNQMAAANAVAAGYLSGHSSEGDLEVQILEEKIHKIWEEINALEEKLSELSKKGKNTDSILSKIEDKREKIEELSDEMSQIAYHRAINYMKANRGWQEQAGYNLELARLYYMLDEKDVARELINQVLSESLGEKDMGYLGPEIVKLLNSYDQTSSGFADKETSVMSLWQAADAVNYGITQGFVSEHYSSESFTDFLVQTVQQYRGKLVISYVNAREFPQLEVHLAASLEEEMVLSAKNLTVYEQGKEITDFELLRNDGSGMELSVCFVLDVSGSMEGDALANAKSAVGNFLKMLEGSDSQVGLVKFADAGEIVSQLTESTGVLSKGIDSLMSGGGTSISNGLLKGMEVLRDSRGTPTILLLSDGADGDASQIGTIKSQLANQGIRVYSIGVGNADGEYLKGISDATGGVYIKAENSADLGTVYRQISQYILQDYVIRLTADSDLENYKRNIKIQWKQEAYDETTYTVGVSEEDILMEQTRGILTDFYEEIGGSGEGVSENGQ